MSSPFPPPYAAAPPPGNPVLRAAGIGAAIALLAANVYLFVQIRDLKEQSAKLHDTMLAAVDELRQNTTSISSSSSKHLDELREQLEDARRQAHMAASQAKSESLAHTEQVARKLEEQQKQQTQQVSSELSQVKESANAKIEAVSGDVNTVKTQVASTKSELDQTISQLKKVQGDLSDTSSYVATNGKELQALKQLGERNYYEFTLVKSKEPHKVSDVQLWLKKADAKHNRYSIAVLADDKTTEKKDRNINEPVQFYTGKARQPYEIVINEVRKDMIKGYLATPKAQLTRN